MKNKTTTEDLPPDVREHFELPQALEGGPQFAFPAYGQGSVDFTRIDLATAEALVARGCKVIQRRPKPAQKTAPVKE